MSDPIDCAINAEHGRQERAWDAYCIAVDQAQDNGAKLALALDALEKIGSQAVCYGMAAEEAELRDWLQFISETAEAALASVGRNPEGEDREDGLRAEHERAVGEAETPKG